jgi:hypothetical protein
MLDEKLWTVDIRLSYSVRAASPNIALGAVLPLLSLGRDRYGAQPEIADYTVHERQQPTAQAPAHPAPPTVTKPIYTAKEIAEILEISVSSVYGRIPSMQIGVCEDTAAPLSSRSCMKARPNTTPYPIPIRHDHRSAEKR